MATCQLCNQPAGWFRSKHKECGTKRANALGEIAVLVRDIIVGKVSLNEGVDKVKAIASNAYIDESALTAAFVKGWETSAELFLDDGLLSVAEQERLMAFAKSCRLSPDALNVHGAYAQVLKGEIIRDVLEGRFPNHANMPPPTARFNFQRNEAVVWIITDVKYYEDKLKYSYEGGSQGASFRIAKGVYYRVGAYKGQRVETQERVYVDTGDLAVTNKHIYFVGEKKSLRIRHDKIISITPYKDGIGLHRDAANARPQVFVTGDGWFVHNLVANAPNLEVPEGIAAVHDPSHGILGNFKGSP